MAIHPVEVERDLAESAEETQQELVGSDVALLHQRHRGADRAERRRLAGRHLAELHPPDHHQLLEELRREPDEVEGPGLILRRHRREVDGGPGIPSGHRLEDARLDAHGRLAQRRAGRVEPERQVRQHARVEADVQALLDEIVEALAQLQERDAEPAVGDRDRAPLRQRPVRAHRRPLLDKTTPLQQLLRVARVEPEHVLRESVASHVPAVERQHARDGEMPDVALVRVLDSRLGVLPPLQPVLLLLELLLVHRAALGPGARLGLGLDLLQALGVEVVEGAVSGQPADVVEGVGAEQEDVAGPPGVGL